LDPVEAIERLQKRLGCLDHFRGRIELQGIRVTRHKRGRRCLVEYDLTLMRPSGADECLTLVGKARARGLDQRCFRLLIALRQAGFNENSRDGIAVPEPVAVVPEFHMWFQRKVPGVLASDVLSMSRDPRIAQRIADAIHKLQRAGIKPARRHTIEDELRLLSQRLATLTAARPQWRSRLERVMEACLRLGRDLDGRQLRPAHRDFYPEQVIVNGERLYLLDFDLYAAADAALDAGNFIAHITEETLRRMGDPDALACHERTIEERFAAVSDYGTRIAVARYATLTLVRHIYISTCIPHRRRFTEAILEICERRLDISRRLPARDLQLHAGLEGINHANSNA
ncbi:MAG: aminoglycoside phosphotransferase family protein, partial [Pyrinomonadaceae bacterium]